MTKFFKKSQNPYFWFHFEQNKISWKKGLCQFLDIPIIYHRAKNQEKVMIYFWEKCRTDGRTDGQTYRQWWFYRTLRKGPRSHYSSITVMTNQPQNYVDTISTTLHLVTDAFYQRRYCKTSWISNQVLPSKY